LDINLWHDFQQLFTPLCGTISIFGDHDTPVCLEAMTCKAQNTKPM